MKIFLCPQLNEMDLLVYTFDGEVVTATLNGETDEFDFTGLPEGKLESVETTLSVNPVVSARKENGELYVELLNFTRLDATEEENFPTWIEV